MQNTENKGVTALSIDSVTTKGDITALAELYAFEISEGNMNPLEVIVILKQLEELAKAIKSNPVVKAAIEAETERYNTGKGEKITARGAIITPRNSSRYAYDLGEFSSELEAYKQEEKRLQAVAKAIKTPVQEVNTLTGEEVTIQPAVKKVTSTFAVTLPK